MIRNAEAGRGKDSLCQACYSRMKGLISDHKCRSVVLGGIGICI